MYAAIHCKLGYNNCNTDWGVPSASRVDYVRARRPGHGVLYHSRHGQRRAPPTLTPDSPHQRSSPDTWPELLSSRRICQIKYRSWCAQVLWENNIVNTLGELQKKWQWLDMRVAGRRGQVLLNIFGHPDSLGLTLAFLMAFCRCESSRMHLIPLRNNLQLFRNHFIFMNKLCPNQNSNQMVNWTLMFVDLNYPRTPSYCLTYRFTLNWSIRWIRPMTSGGARAMTATGSRWSGPSIPVIQGHACGL